MKPTMKPLFEMTVDYSWWHAHYQPAPEGKKAHMKGKWADLLREKFEELKQNYCNCELSVMTNRLVPVASRKYKDNAFTGSFYCRFKTMGCKRLYDFKVLGFPVEDEPIKIFVERSGKRGPHCKIRPPKKQKVVLEDAEDAHEDNQPPLHEEGCTAPESPDVVSHLWHQCPFQEGWMMRDFAKNSILMTLEDELLEGNCKIQMEDGDGGIQGYYYIPLKDVLDHVPAKDLLAITAEDESEKEGKDVECPLCFKFGKPKAGDDNAHTCTLCQVPIHAFGCSVSRGSGEEGYGGNDLLCIACSKKPTKTISAPSICQLCRTDAGEGHVCSCHICNGPIDPALDIADTVTCYRCQRTCHDIPCSSLITAIELDVANNKRSICAACEHSSKTGMSLAAFQDIDLQNMLTDEHMQRASSMLKEEFGGKIDGLSCPLSVTYGEKVEEINYYPPRNRARDYLQIMHTGRSNHWVTALFMKGSSTVTILDSLRTTGLSGHTKMQCAMIAQSDESNVIIVRPPCAQQKNSVDCALYSIAHAVEFCNVGKVQFIDFDPSQLRSHWKQCVETGKLSVFPRRSTRPKRTLEEDDVCVLEIYCTCRLPDSVDNMILCELCGSWFHKACVGVKEDPGTSWVCKKCKA